MDIEIGGRPAPKNLKEPYWIVNILNQFRETIHFMKVKGEWDSMLQTMSIELANKEDICPQIAFIEICEIKNIYLLKVMPFGFESNN